MSPAAHGRPRRRDAAEQAAWDALLNDPSASAADPVGKILDAARRAPAGPPPGLDDALAAFRRGDPPRRERRGAVVWRRALATTLTTKLVAGATAAAAAAAGITVAVTVPHRHGAPHPGTPTSATSGPTNGSASRSGPSAPSSNPTGSSSASGSATSSGAASTAGSHAPQPAFARLCRGWPADPAQQQRQGRSPAFAALVNAAGGIDRVTSYCVQVVGVTPHASVSESRPTRAGTPTTSRPKHPSTKPAPTVSLPSPTR